MEKELCFDKIIKDKESKQYLTKLLPKEKELEKTKKSFFDVLINPDRVHKLVIDFIFSITLFDLWNKMGFYTAGKIIIPHYDNLKNWHLF